MRKHLGAYVVAIAFILAVASLVLLPTPRELLAQGFGLLSLYGGTGSAAAVGRPVGVPAYLKSAHITTATTTIVKNAPGVLGCVVVNKGASSTTATLYNAFEAVSGYDLAVINTATPIEFCYGMIFSGAITVVTTGTADLTVTYR